MRVAIIPARGGSRRIPRKNIKPFHGKPIIAYSIEAAQASGLFDEIYVSTEDQEIGELAMRYSVRWLVRNAQFSKDEVGTQDVMREALREISDGHLDSMTYMGPVATAACIYPCAPMLQAYDLQRACQMLEHSKAEYVVPIGEWLKDPGMFYFGTRQAFVTGVPLNGAWTLLLPVPVERCIDINTAADWSKAERMYETLNARKVA